MELKSVLVTKSVGELQKWLDQGWTPAVAAPHSNGALMILQKAKTAKPNKRH